MRTAEPPGTPEKWVVIPRRFRDEIREATGYDGPWRVRRQVFDALIEAAGLSDRVGPADQQGPPGGGGSSAGGGGSTTIVIGGGGGGGMSPEQRANLRAAFLEILHRWGMRLTKNLEKLVDQGVRNSWSTTNFIQHLRKTPEYREHFPGIRSEKGYDEAQYNRDYDAYETYAKLNGVKLTRKTFGVLFRRDVPFDEWRARVDFIARYRRNPEYWQQVVKVAKARGIVPPDAQFTKKDMYRIATRRGAPQIERLIEEAHTRYLLKQAGILVGPDGDVTRGELLKVIRKLETEGSEVERFTSEQYANLARMVDEVIPAAEQVGYGITKRDLFELQFGGPRRREIARHVQAVLASVEFEAEPNVQPVLVEDERGKSRLTGGFMQRPKSL